MDRAAIPLLLLCALWACWVGLWFAEADLARLRGEKPRRPPIKVPVILTVALVYLILRHHP